MLTEHISSLVDALISSLVDALFSWQEAMFQESGGGLPDGGLVVAGYIFCGGMCLLLIVWRRCSCSYGYQIHADLYVQ